MREPLFWYGEAAGRDAAPLLQAALWPLGQLYAAAGAWRQARARPVRATVPVVCVGNLTVGGAGKTPVVRAVRALAQAAGVTTASLSRGYGGRARGPLVLTAGMTAAEVGDEPLLHARDGLAVVARDRPAGAATAAATGARLVVMDDGFQNPTLFKDLSLLVVDAARGFGNGRVFPAGPLREPAARGLKRADAVVLMRAGPEAAGGPAPAGLEGFQGPILEAWLVPAGPPPPGPLLAFAGIAQPTKFFDALARWGGQVVEAAPYPDHHPYTAHDIAWLRTFAAERGARLITTEKDHVRLPPDARAEIAVLPVTCAFAAPDGLAGLLQPIFERAR